MELKPIKKALPSRNHKTAIKTTSKLNHLRERIRKAKARLFFLKSKEAE